MVVLVEGSIAFSIDHSGGLWGGAHVRALCTASGQPGSQSGILARVLGSWPWRDSCPWRLIIGSGFSADSLSWPADPPLSFLPQFRLWALSGSPPPSPFFPGSRLTLAKASTPNPALPDQNEPIPSPLSLPTPPDSSCWAETCPVSFSH